MTGKRKRYSADFKAKIALEALRGDLTTAQLASKHGIHQTMVGEWKRQAVEGLAAGFSDRSAGPGTAKASQAELIQAAKLSSRMGPPHSSSQRGILPSPTTSTGSCCAARSGHTYFWVSFGPTPTRSSIPSIRRRSTGPMAASSTAAHSTT